MCSNPTGPYPLCQVTGHCGYSSQDELFDPSWSHGGLHETASSIEYHHYYGLHPWCSCSLCGPWQLMWQHPWPATTGVSAAPAPPPLQAESSWPEGASLKLQLQWGRPWRAYGARRDLPDFVRQDLRRVYGTYPRTDVSIARRGGEYVVRGDPRVGRQEYRVEKKVVRQLEGPRDGGVGEAAERGKRKKR